MNKINSLFVIGLVITNSIVAAQERLNSSPQPHYHQRIISNEIGRKLAKKYLAKTPIKTNPNLTITEAKKVQNDFIQEIKPSLGNIVGYKVALSNQEVQKRFNINTPLAGVLLEKMLLPSGATIPANFASVPMVEGDLMVRVGSDNINQATTPSEILANLDAIIPFIELPDLIYDKNTQIDAAALVAVNVGARLGILGEVIELTNNNNWLKKINQIELTMSDKNNEIIGQGSSNLLLENPLNVVLWLKNDLQAQGKKLKKGDLISLGTITQMIPVSSGQVITAQYKGLLDNQIVEISVTFE